MTNVSSLYSRIVGSPISSFVQLFETCYILAQWGACANAALITYLLGCIENIDCYYFVVNHHNLNVPIRVWSWAGRLLFDCRVITVNNQPSGPNIVARHHGDSITEGRSKQVEGCKLFAVVQYKATYMIPHPWILKKFNGFAHISRVLNLCGGFRPTHSLPWRRHCSGQGDFNQTPSHNAIIRKFSDFEMVFVYIILDLLQSWPYNFLNFFNLFPAIFPSMLHFPQRTFASVV